MNSEELKRAFTPEELEKFKKMQTDINKYILSAMDDCLNNEDYLFDEAQFDKRITEYVPKYSDFKEADLQYIMTLIVTGYQAFGKDFFIKVAQQDPEDIAMFMEAIVCIGENLDNDKLES